MLDAPVRRQEIDAGARQHQAAFERFKKRSAALGWREALSLTQCFQLTQEMSADRSRLFEHRRGSLK
jgi:hypothetical protein